MNHIFVNVDLMIKSGFTGFQTIGDLIKSNHVDTDVKGVYFVLFPSDSHPTFVLKGSGGHFKGKDPNMSIEVLEKKWVKGTGVIYIGKGGEFGKKSTLHSRLSDYLRFGQGKKVGHWGGRYIFQLENYKELIICWKDTKDNNPPEVETELIDKFISIYGKLPFGNLRR